MVDYKGIGEKLKNYFASIGLPQKEIAKELGVSQQAVGALLNGKAFGKRTAARWEEKFGIKANWLLTGEGEMLVSENNEYKNINESGNESELIKTLLEELKLANQEIGMLKIENDILRAQLKEEDEKRSAG